MNRINLHKEYCGQKKSISKTRHHFREDCSPLLPEKTTIDHQQKCLISHVLVYNYLQLFENEQTCNFWEKNKTKHMLLHVCPFVGLHVLVITSMWVFYCYFKVQFSYYLQHIFGLEIIDSALHRKHCCSMQHTLSGTKSNKYGYGSGSIYSIVMFAKHMLCLNKLCQ